MSISLTERLIVAIYYCFIGVVGIFANVSLIIVLYRLKEYRNRPSTSYLYSILLASVLASVFQIPYFAHNVLANLPPPSQNAYNVECRISIFIAYSISTVKIFLLMALSIDRYIAVAYPYFYNKYTTRATTGIANTFFWLLPIPIITPLSALDNGCEYQGKIGSSCGVTWSLIDINYLVILLVVVYVIPCAVVAVTNVKVFIIARKQKRVIASETERFGTREDALQRDITAEEEPFEVESESISDNVLIITRVKSLANKSRETEFIESLSEMQESKNCPTSNKTESIASVGNNPQKQNRNIHGKSASSRCRSLADPLTYNFPTSFQNTSESETKIDKTRQIFTMAIEKNSRTQNYFGKTVAQKHTSSWSSRKKIVQRNDWGLIASTLMLAGAFLVTWTPFTISRAYETLVETLSIRSALYPAATTLLDIVLNPLIILGTRANLRREYKNTLCFR